MPADPDAGLQQKPNIMEKGSKVKVLVDGKLKDGYVIGTVPTLWGGESVVVKIGKKELVFDKKSIRK